MKTTIDIPDAVLEDAMTFSKAKTKRAAVLTAIQDYNRRQRMARLTRHLGTCMGMVSIADLEKSRESP